MFDFIRITPDGEPMVDLSNLTRDQAAALSETMVEDFTEGRGELARDVRRVKIKLHDKLSALHKLGIHIGMFAEKRTHDLEEGNPIVEVLRAMAGRSALPIGSAKPEKSDP